MAARTTGRSAGAGSVGVTPEQQALAEAVDAAAGQARLLAAARSAAEGDHGLPPGWDLLARQEILTIPYDGTAVDVCVVAEVLGRHAAPGPATTTLLAALLCAHSDSGADAALDELRAGVAGGSTAIAVQVGAVLLGVDGATHALVPDATRGWLVTRLPAGALKPHDGIDPTRRVAYLPAGDEAGIDLHFADGMGEAATALVLAAEAVGVASWCLATATDYAKVREQFGKPIGAFQAVKHRCAGMLARLEPACAAVWDAAHALDAALADPSAVDDETRLTIDVATAVATDAAVACAKDCIQILGGIGYTWEHDAHLYLKRALALRQLLGGTAQRHRNAARLAAAGVRRQHRLDLGTDAEPVRRAVRAFLDTVRDLPSREQRVAVADAGYLVPHWPAPYGRGAGPLEQLVIDEEFRAAGVARPDLVIGAWALPTILQYGTDAQRARFVPATLHGDITWCQMFSEPGAGSDLASLSTKAVRVDGGWSLSGQKVWTSGARHADWAICLARTSTGERRHEGITYFLVDMRSPGLDVRPLRELTGDALFNEIFLTDVFVPDECVVGDVGDGWRLARTTLANERVAMSSGAAFPSGVEELLTALRTSPHPDDAGVLERVGALVCLAQADGALGVRATLARVSGTDPGAASSVRKLVGMHLRQDAAELALELAGLAAVTAEGPAYDVVQRVLATRALTIAGGTSEVLHNVIAERLLGLPRG